MAERFTDRLAHLRGLDWSERKSREYFLGILANVEKFGLAVTSVASSDMLGWSYSIGLYDTYGQPEILVSGFPPDLGQSVLNSIGERYRAGDRLHPNERWSDLLGNGIECIFKPMNPTFMKKMMLSCGWFYGENITFPAYQCVCPDFENRFPWEGGFDESWRDRQALLFDGAPVGTLEKVYLEQ